MITRPHRRRLLLGIDAFMGIVAGVCGAILMAGKAETVIQMNPAVLDGTPFASFLVPGIFLGLAVGGSYLIATASLLRQREWGVLASAVAGCIMLGWIIGELLFVGWIAPLFLQPFIATYALLTIGVALREGTWRQLAH